MPLRGLVGNRRREAPADPKRTLERIWGALEADPRVDARSHPVTLSLEAGVITLEGELASGRVRHGMNPLLTWCASNAIATRDPAGNRKLDKSKATGRIDGMVALAMALGAATRDATINEDVDGFLSNPVRA